MKNDIIKPQNLFPIRIISYDIGALLLEILKAYKEKCPPLQASTQKVKK